MPTRDQPGKAARSLLFLLSIAALLHAPGLTPLQRAYATGEKSRYHAFAKVNLVPMTEETVVPGQTVLILGQQIIAVGPDDEVAIPDGARVVDGRGGYLMPGTLGDSSD